MIKSFGITQSNDIDFVISEMNRIVNQNQQQKSQQKQQQENQQEQSNGTRTN